MHVFARKTAPQKRAAQEKKNLHSNVADSQELLAALMEQNALLEAQNGELTQQLADMQEALSNLNANA